MNKAWKRIAVGIGILLIILIYGQGFIRVYGYYHWMIMALQDTSCQKIIDVQTEKEWPFSRQINGNTIRVAYFLNTANQIKEFESEYHVDIEKLKVNLYENTLLVSPYEIKDVEYCLNSHITYFYEDLSPQLAEKYRICKITYGDFNNTKQLHLYAVNKIGVVTTDEYEWHYG